MIKKTKKTRQIDKDINFLKNQIGGWKTGCNQEFYMYMFSKMFGFETSVLTEEIYNMAKEKISILEEANRKIKLGDSKEEKEKAEAEQHRMQSIITSRKLTEKLLSEAQSEIEKLKAENSINISTGATTGVTGGSRSFKNLKGGSNWDNYSVEREKKSNYYRDHLIKIKKISEEKMERVDKIIDNVKKYPLMFTNLMAEMWNTCIKSSDSTQQIYSMTMLDNNTLKSNVKKLSLHGDETDDTLWKQSYIQDLKEHFRNKELEDEKYKYKQPDSTGRENYTDYLKRLKRAIKGKYSKDGKDISDTINKKYLVDENNEKKLMIYRELKKIFDKSSPEFLDYMCRGNLDDSLHSELVDMSDDILVFHKIVIQGLGEKLYIMIRGLATLGLDVDNAKEFYHGQSNQEEKNKEKEEPVSGGRRKTKKKRKTNKNNKRNKRNKRIKQKGGAESLSDDEEKLKENIEFINIDPDDKQNKLTKAIYVALTGDVKTKIMNLIDKKDIIATEQDIPTDGKTIVVGATVSLRDWDAIIAKLKMRSQIQKKKPDKTYIDDYYVLGFYESGTEIYHTGTTIPIIYESDLINKRK